MSKIRLLRVAFNDLGHGGIQSNIMIVTKRLQSEVDTDIIVFNSKPAFYDEEFKKYGRIFRRPNYEGKNWLRKRMDYYIRYFRIKRNILDVIKQYGPYDVVHSHSFFEAAPCMAAARKAGVPIRIAHSHNTAMPDRHVFPIRQLNRLYRNIYRKIILRDSTVRIGCSQAAADYLFGKGNGYPINNCVDCERFRPYNFPEKDWSELRLIHVGNFLPQKNQLFLLDVFYELLKINPDCHLTMIGRTSEYKEKVVDRINELGIMKQVSLLPHDSDIASELSKADFFVFPSNFEGFGNVLLEAQAAGLHCFASTEVTKEVNCGLITYCELDLGAAKWAQIIYEYYGKYGSEKKIVDMDQFSEEKFAQKFLKLYKRAEK